MDFKAGIVRIYPGPTKNDEGLVSFFTDELRAVIELKRAKHEASQEGNG